MDRLGATVCLGDGTAGSMRSNVGVTPPMPGNINNPVRINPPLLAMSPVIGARSDYDAGRLHSHRSDPGAQQEAAVASAEQRQCLSSVPGPAAEAPSMPGSVALPFQPVSESPILLRPSLVQQPQGASSSRGPAWSSMSGPTRPGPPRSVSQEFRTSQDWALPRVSYAQPIIDQPLGVPVWAPSVAQEVPVPVQYRSSSPLDMSDRPGNMPPSVALRTPVRLDSVRSPAVPGTMPGGFKRGLNPSVVTVGGVPQTMV